MDKWSKVAYREMALEKIRKRVFSYLSFPYGLSLHLQDLTGGAGWAKFFQDIGRDVYSIVQTKSRWRVFRW